MAESEITEVITGCAIKVHESSRTGLEEPAYEECMDYDFTQMLTYSRL